MPMILRGIESSQSNYSISDAKCTAIITGLSQESLLYVVLKSLETWLYVVKINPCDFGKDPSSRPASLSHDRRRGFGGETTKKK